MKVGDAVRLQQDSPLRTALAPWAEVPGRVAETLQVDDDELRLVVTFCDPVAVDVSPLWPEDVVIDRSRPGEPF